MTSILRSEPIGRVVVGVDTRKYVHTAVVVDVGGGTRGNVSVAADRGGHEQLTQWAAQFGQILDLVQAGRVRGLDDRGLGLVGNGAAGATTERTTLVMVPSLPRTG